jgi:hypothetical protein
MPQLTSYSLAKPLSPQGTVIGDVSYITPRRGPVVLKAVGDVIDLTRVDFNQFVHSSLNGALRNLLVTGVLVSVLVDAPEEVEKKVLSLISELMAGKTTHGVQGVQSVRMLEPGVQVMVGNAPESTDRPQPARVMPEAAAVEPSVQLEPGLMAPGGMSPEQEKAQAEARGEDGDGKELPSSLPPAAGAPDWKDNLALGQQKKALSTSQDRNFLATVAENAEEPATLRNIAKNRIKELGAA